ncbi:LapA family protein [Georgenia subflava]|uniref:hypothetical protein n=1 Tax=Georgenia subflava TaxID=1622177 RepID=UPI001D0045E5|nr:hypothetical protein [Georgenia subflava]
MTRQDSGSRNGFVSFLRGVSASTWVGLALAVLAVVFVLQNQAVASIQLFWVSVRAPIWLALLAVFLVGWLVGALVRHNRAR